MTRRPSLMKKLRGTALLTMIVGVGCVGGMIAWAASAPLAGAAIATGTFAPETSRKTVQHLEGGIVRDILVRDGDRVEAGQPLFILESATARATLDSQRGMQIRLEAARDRLDALLKRDGQYDAAAQLARAPDDAAYTAFVARQVELFDTLRRGVTEKRDILLRQIAQLEADIAQGEAMIGTITRQLPLLKTQLSDQEYLLEKGLTRKPVVLELQRQREKMEGDLQAYAASASKSREQIAEKRLQLNSVETDFQRVILDERVRVNTELADVMARIAATRDIVGRSTVLSPEKGTVLNLRIKTPGGVVGPGQPLIDLVPEGDELVITGRIVPSDIAYVHAGAKTNVNFLAYPQRGMPMVPGIVKSVSADLITDPNARIPGTETYYEAKISIDRKTLNETAPWVEIVPGMPVEAYIETNPRVALDYILEPFTRSFHRAFREL